MTCSLTNVPPTVDSFGQFIPRVSIDDPSLPPTAMIDLTADVDIGMIDFPAQVQNKSAADGQWNGDGIPGTATLEISFTNPTGGQCLKQKQFEVTF